MKKMNKKGFTIVELSIVIAVIAILSAVMIPTFSNIVNKSKESTRLQLATNAYHVALGATDGNEPIILTNDKAPIDAYICVEQDDKKYWYTLESGEITALKETDYPTIADGKTAPEEYEELGADKIGEELNGVTFYISTAK